MQAPTKTSLVDSFVGKYKVTREIGRGGFGVVYEVIQQSIGHRAAAKLLSPALASDPKHQKYIERFIDEARAVNLINHPGVLKIFDLGELPDKTMYILMEYLEGESLQARIDKYQLDGKRLSARKIFQLASQLAGALAQAHDRGVIHRDLKPDKITPVEKALQNPLFRERKLGNDYLVPAFASTPTPYCSSAYTSTFV